MISFTGKIQGEEQFAKAIKNYIAETRLSFPVVIKKEAQLLANTLTNPRVKGGTPPLKREDGKKAVEADINKVFHPISEAYFEKNWKNQSQKAELIALLREKKFSELRKIFAKFSGPSIELAGADAKIHRKYRNSRGRVNRRSSPYYTFNTDSVQKYIEGVQRRVGMARGGWAVSLVALGGKAAGWIKDNASGLTGDFEDHLKDPVNLYVKMVNSSPWAKRGRENALKLAYEGRVYALRRKIRDLNSGNLKKLRAGMTRKAVGI